MTALLLRFLRDETARGTVELLLVAGTAALIVPSMENVGARVAAIFAKVARALH